MTATARLVSIIIPTIGRPRYIGGTVASALEQDYEDLEILISDNYPDVPTEAVLGSVTSDRRVRIASRDRRIEPGDHFNVCLQEARGHYVMILSDDDLLSKHYVTQMVSAIESDAEIMVALGAQCRLSESDQLIPATFSGSHGEGVYEGLDFMRQHFGGALRFPIFTYVSLFARRGDILDVGGFRPYPDGSHADNLLFYSLALRGKVAAVNAAMGYRVYASSSGLGTPIDRLYSATIRFLRDLRQLIENDRRLVRGAKAQLLRRVRRSLTSLLMSRIRTIYWSKMSWTERLVWLTRIGFFGASGMII